MNIRGAGVLLTIGFLAAATTQAAQRGWVAQLKSSGVSTMRQGALIVRPQAEIGGQANGVYCVPATENGVAMHDLGGLPPGLNVRVTVEGLSEGFDPVAAVIVAMLGERAANSVRATTFYDNDSGGDRDAKIEFVTPQSGSYILLVNDFPDKVAGCYRYEVVLRQ